MLTIFSQVEDLQVFLNKEKSAGKSIGFVPTMGALHTGHLSLIERSKQENDITVCSIFVNPIQFNNPDDFALYPRDYQKDEQILEAAGCNILFLPTVDEVYPDPAMRKIDFDPGALGNKYEGASRPGHFAGMVAVVKRLFDIIRPTASYFGQKDYQQYLIVKKMIRHYHLPLRLVMCPIFREPNGLAMSSRNERLSPENREEAALIYRTLSKAELQIKKGVNLDTIKKEAIADFDKNGNFQVDYFDICSAEGMEPAASTNIDSGLLICTAVILGGVRLLDNILVL
jgi:pantoate--beta-alanine ligase